jgi:phage-related protein
VLPLITEVTVTKYTGNLYTINQKPDKVQRPTIAVADVVWMGNSHEVIKDFPSEARQSLGRALREVQEGRKPADSKPVPGLGRSGVFELRDQDADAWYRVIYLKKIAERIFVLHCFEKESNKIDKQEMRTIEARLGRVERLLEEEKRDERARNK